tara:strand:- start:2541 stop:3104 length:564 start_codon:yes stop_codon:yes gene_type:complete
MRSPFFFIVKPLEGRRYNNTKKLSGLDFITSTSEENHAASNRIGIVESTPIDYNGPIKRGDQLLVHHNVFKYYNDMRGRQRSGRSFFKDDLFFIENDQFYMYKQDDQWHCHDRYCFIKPVAKEDFFLYKNFKNEPLVGLVKYANNYLKSQGVNDGDKITFKPESEYEFEVDGEKLYRMYDHQITMVL